ncbi:hypothetical protein D3C76_1134270 [compost metagenome]
MACTGGHQPLTDVAPRRHLAAQAVHRVLMYHTPLGAQQAAAFGLAHAVQRVVFIQNLAILRGQTGRDRLQQSSFTGAGLADNAQHFPRPQVERHVAEAFARRIEVGQVIDRKQRFHWLLASLCWRQ